MMALPSGCLDDELTLPLGRVGRMCEQLLKRASLSRMWIMHRWKSSIWISYVLTHPALTAAGWIQSCLSTELKLTTASFSSSSPSAIYSVHPTSSFRR